MASIVQKHLGIARALACATADGKRADREQTTAALGIGCA
jgi:hypothetical protein